jgi:hypothetical protein
MGSGERRQTATIASSATGNHHGEERESPAARHPQPPVSLLAAVFEPALPPAAEPPAALPPEPVAPEPPVPPAPGPAHGEPGGQTSGLFE